MPTNEIQLQYPGQQAAEVFLFEPVGEDVSLIRECQSF